LKAALVQPHYAFAAQLHGALIVGKCRRRIAQGLPDVGAGVMRMRAQWRERNRALDVVESPFGLFELE